LGHYFERERAKKVKGPMVTQITGCKIPHCDLAIYLCKALGIGEDLNRDQAFQALAALGISPKGGWRVDEPPALITQREIEEICNCAREAYEKGLIETDETDIVVLVNEYILWLKMNIKVVGETIFAEIIALTYGHGGGTIPIARGGEVASSSQ
jgi:hypothetical protein